MKGSALKKAPRPRHGSNKASTKLISSPPKVRFQEPIGHSLPQSLQNFRWNVDKVERKLQEKIQEKTKIAGNFVYQQAYRLLECTRGKGIDFPSFREQLRTKFGIILDDYELQLLFDKYDEDGNGTIDLHEFIRHVLPPDYNYGRQWFELSQQESEEKLARLKRESRNEFLSGTGAAKDGDGIHNTGETSNWTIETLMKQIQFKVVQRTPSGDDQYRRAFKMLRAGRDQGIRMKELRNNLKTKFGIFVSETQMVELFSQFDIDGSGEIDLQEFLQFVEPPAYPGNSAVPNGLWTELNSDDDDDNALIVSARIEPSADRSSDAAQLRAGHRNHQPTTNEPAASTDDNQAFAKKERPKSANPKKSALLQQRRTLEQALSQNAALLQNVGAQPHQTSLDRANGSLSRRCSAMSFAEYHDTALATTAAVDGNDKYASYRYNDNDDDVQSYGSGATCDTGGRPRSAGSVRSSRGSVASSTTSSVRGAAYMKRPSTAQFLRLKCLESRLANATAEEVAKTAMRMKKRASLQDASKVDDTSTYSEGTASPSLPVRRDRHHTVNEASPKAWQAPSKHHHVRTKQQDQAMKNVIDGDDDDFDAPRVVKVHPKQHDVRPFSQSGRVLRRNKVMSTGCR